MGIFFFIYYYFCLLFLCDFKIQNHTDISSLFRVVKRITITACLMANEYIKLQFRVTSHIFYLKVSQHMPVPTLDPAKLPGCAFQVDATKMGPPCELVSSQRHLVVGNWDGIAFLPNSATSVAESSASSRSKAVRRGPPPNKRRRDV